MTYRRLSEQQRTRVFGKKKSHRSTFTCAYMKQLMLCGVFIWTTRGCRYRGSCSRDTDWCCRTTWSSWGADTAGRPVAASAGSFASSGSPRPHSCGCTRSTRPTRWLCSLGPDLRKKHITSDRKREREKEASWNLLNGGKGLFSHPIFHERGEVTLPFLSIVLNLKRVGLFFLLPFLLSEFRWRQIYSLL